ncbi:RNA polymerase-associated protein RapA [compost metagenome]
MSDFVERLSRLPWRRSFDSGALVRGEAYARENRVRILQLEADKVLARCRGSGKHSYQLQIRLEANGYIDAECDCPVGYDCKHCVATLLHLLEQAPVPAAREMPLVEPAKVLAEDLRAWLKKLPRESGKPAPAEPEQLWRLHYRLTKSGRVSACRVRLGDDGSVLEYGHGIPLALAGTHSSSDPLDRQIAALAIGIPGANTYNPDTLLEGAIGAEVLGLIVDGGRLFLDPRDPATRLRRGEPVKTSVAWRGRQDGSFTAGWKMEDDASLTALDHLDPPWYFDKSGHRVGLMQLDLPLPLARHILKVPVIEADQALLFSLALKDIVPQAPTPTPCEEQRRDDIQPIAHLHLISHRLGVYERIGREQHTHVHLAGLSFRYGEQRVVGSPRGEPTVRHFDGQQFVSITRQVKAEQALRKRLKDCGFYKATKYEVPYSLEGKHEYFLLPSEQDWLAFMERLPDLRARGWVIEMAEDFRFDTSEIDGWFADIDEESGNDWFDLELGIIVDGQRISLLPVLLRLIRQRPDLLHRCTETPDGKITVVLDARHSADNKRLRVNLPMARIQPILATLGELYLADGEDEFTRLRLSALDAARLSAFDELPLEWQGGERLRAFAQRLHDYHIRPCPAPAGLQANLRPYQIEGLAWMQALRELGAGGVLGDDMGLGKTLQALAHILTEKQAGRLDLPALVVMPTSLIANWQDEAARFAPDLRVLTLHGSQRHSGFADLQQHDLILTTYALLPRDIEALCKQPLHLLILDEAQYIKNATSKAAQAALRLEARQRLCLTGTPLENHLGELWSLFNLLMPGWLGNSRDFTRHYRTPIEKRGDSQRLAHLNARIKPFLLRRRKDQVATELPAKTEIVQWVELSQAQRDLYETVRLAMDRKVRDEIERKGLAGSHIVILDALLKLRQVCCDPRLLKSASGSTARSGKLDSLLEMIEELLAEGRRILLFSQFTSMLALIETELQKREIAYNLLTGDTQDRRSPVQDFQSGKVPLFLISLKAGGTGLNLTAADTVIHYDPWWNPATENQATDRAYRIGQDKPVFVYKLIARGTLEEKIQQLQQRKAALAAGVLESGKDMGLRLESSDIDALFAPLPPL